MVPYISTAYPYKGYYTKWYSLLTWTETYCSMHTSQMCKL